MGCLDAEPLVRGSSWTLTSIWSGERGQVPAVLHNQGASMNKHSSCNECSQAGAQQGMRFRRHKAVQDADGFVQTGRNSEQQTGSNGGGGGEDCPFIVHWIAHAMLITRSQ